MNFLIIGVGRMGSAIAYSLMLLRTGNTFSFFEPKNKRMGLAEYLDLEPVADATGNYMRWCMRWCEATENEKLPNAHLLADAMILTAGLPRTDSTAPKSALLKTNLPIAEELTKDFAGELPVFVVTNPPNEIARELERRGQKAIPLRRCTDTLRANCTLRSHTAKDVNEYVLNHKGYTMWTPAYACAKEILRVMERGK